MRAKPAHHAQTFRAVAAALLVTACALTAAACGSSDKSAATKTTQPDPARAPADVHWQNYQGVQLPIGEHDGPSKLGTAAAGYSRTRRARPWPPSTTAPACPWPPTASGPSWRQAPLSPAPPRTPGSWPAPRSP